MVTQNGGDEQEHEGHTCFTIGSKRWSWHDFGFLTLVTVSNAIGCAAAWFGNIATCLKADANYRQNKKQFAAEVFDDIRKL